MGEGVSKNVQNCVMSFTDDPYVVLVVFVYTHFLILFLLLSHNPEVLKPVSNR
jgi:hypothetical protein